MQARPANFIYLDSDAIDGQFSIEFANILESTQGTEKEVTGGTEGEMEGKITGIFGGKFSLKGEAKKTTKHESKTTYTTDMKACALIDKHSTYSNGFSLLNTLNMINVDNSIMIYGYATFYSAELFVDGSVYNSSIYRDIDVKATIALVAGNCKMICERYGYSLFDYVHDSPLGIHMFMGTENLRYRVRHLGRQMNKGGHIRLWILGIATRLDVLEYTIKPLAAHPHMQSW